MLDGVFLTSVNEVTNLNILNTILFFPSRSKVEETNHTLDFVAILNLKESTLHTLRTGHFYNRFGFAFFGQDH